MSEFYSSDQSDESIQPKTDHDPLVQCAELVTPVPGDTGAVVEYEHAAPAVPVDPKVPGFAQMLLFMLLFFSVSMVIAVAIFAANAVVVFVFGGDLADVNANQELLMFWVTAVGNTLAVLVCLLVGKLWSGRPWSELLPFKRIHLGLLPALTLLGTGIAILLSEVDNLTQFFLPMPQFLREMFEQLLAGGFTTFFLLLVVAPWTEELLFRGFVLNGFLKRYKPRNAVMLSALGFAILHLNPYQLFGTFVIGVFLGWVRLKSRSLWPCIFLHMVFNGVASLAMILPADIPGFNMTEGHFFQPWWFDMTGVGLAVAGCYLTYRLMQERLQQREVQARW